MPKVTEEMVRNELQDIVCSELNGEKYYSFDSVLYVVQRLATSWEAERLETQPGPPEDKIKAAMDILYDGKPNKWGRKDYLHAMRSSDVKFVYDLLKETLGPITPPAEQPEPPKCKICGEPVKPEQQRRHATPVRLGEIVAEHCDLMTCIQSLREALAAARKAGK